MLLLFVGIFTNFGPAPASMEGMVYFTIPQQKQLSRIEGILVQSLALTGLLNVCVAGLRRQWLN